MGRNKIILFSVFAIALLMVHCKKDSLIEEPLGQSSIPEVPDTTGSTTQDSAKYKCSSRVIPLNVDSVLNLLPIPSLIIIEGCECDTIRILAVGTANNLFAAKVLGWADHETQVITTNTLSPVVFDRWIGDVVLDDFAPFSIFSVVIDLDKCDS